MPLDISDAQDSFLSGRAEFNKWADEFMTRWMLPDLILMLAASVKMAGTKGILDNPEAVMKTAELVKQLTGRNR